MSKIDINLLNTIETLNNQTKDVDCLVYASNYFLARRYLNNTFDKVVEYPFIKAFGIKTDLNNIKKIANLKQVKYISSITKVFAQMNIAKDVLNFNEDLKKYTGSGVTVAIIDTGISEHVDFCSFSNRIIHFEDFINKKTVPYDDNGHGTFVSGVLAGNGFFNGRKYSGIAPKANIIMLKALDESGETGALTILNAMQWISDNRQKYNIKVVCMSLGSQPLESGDPLVVGAEALWNLGLVVIAAAGNSGPNYSTIKSPGASGKIITVGALDDGRNLGQTQKQNYKVANFSSRGPSNNFYKPDCLTPGVDIISVSNNGNIYTKMSGTSVSTPMVAGAVCLLLEKYSNLSPLAVKSRILSSCDQVFGERNSEGFGLLNLKKLLK